ncbi:uncharacterized protein TNCV_1041521 [Trichonephila clavipes]|nr:uncharacterized protein TNCV_1041521 [Trichonephila clavipes]
MNAAVHEAVIANDNNSNIAVAVNGTWHKRGYSSLNGVVCATSLLRTERLSTLKLSQNIVLHAERIVNKVSLEARNKRSLKRKMDKQNLDEENEYQAGNINQIYNNRRDQSQITHLGRQLYPRKGKFFQECYADATSKPYGDLLIDLKLETDESLRVRTGMFPGDVFMYINLDNPLL